MQPRFEPNDIPPLVEKYWEYSSLVQTEREQNISDHLAPAFRQRGHLTKEDLIILAKWKSPRVVPNVEKNTEKFVEEVTRVALSPEVSEELRIKILSVLDGVQWAVASVVWALFAAGALMEISA